MALSYKVVLKSLRNIVMCSNQGCPHPQSLQILIILIMEGIVDDDKIHNYDVICDDKTGKLIITRFLRIIMTIEKM